MNAAVYPRLRVTDPARWHAVALTWRRWAALAGRLAADLATDLARVAAAWSGDAATAALARAAALRRRLVLFRVLCWQADQATSEFATALERAKRLLARAAGSGATIDDTSVVRSLTAPPSLTHPATAAALATQAAATAAAAADVSAALTVAARADDRAAERLDHLAAAPTGTPPSGRPPCSASPAEVHRWWAGLTTAERQWLLATEPAALAPLDGIPAADRDAANRLLLEDRRAEIDRSLATAAGGDRKRLRELRGALDVLTDRLAGEDGPRPYLLRLDLTEEGRTVLALGDPDRADNVVTHVPGMTADLASFPGELSRAARVAERATELSPAASTSAVLWLDYDAPDFVDEAASARRAEAGAPTLRRFMTGLRATQENPTAHHTLIGHSYGSLTVGKAATGTPLPADELVFVGSPGVGVNSASALTVPATHIWSSTAHNDPIQYAAPAPAPMLARLGLAAASPLTAPFLGLTAPQDNLWFGRNPSTPSFGAHTFPSSESAGHLGYWDPGSPSLDALATITLGTPR